MSHDENLGAILDKLLRSTDFLWKLYSFPDSSSKTQTLFQTSWPENYTISGGMYPYG